MSRLARVVVAGVPHHVTQAGGPEQLGAMEQAAVCLLHAERLTNAQEPSRPASAVQQTPRR
jgi:hypothetical protein